MFKDKFFVEFYEKPGKLLTIIIDLKFQGIIFN